MGGSNRKFDGDDDMKNVHEGPASESNLLQAGIIKSLLDSIPDMVFYKDLHGVYLGCNAAFARQLGRNETEVTGRTDYDFYCPEEADGYREGDRMTLIGRTPRHIEDWMRWPDGSLRLIDTIKSPLLSGDGTLIGVVGVCRDVIEIKQAEEEALKAKAKAQESEERYRALEKRCQAIFSTLLHKLFSASAHSLARQQKQESKNRPSLILFDFYLPLLKKFRNILD
jgi:PAS domain S-box-containing protein